VSLCFSFYTSVSALLTATVVVALPVFWCTLVAAHTQVAVSLSVCFLGYLV